MEAIKIVNPIEDFMIDDPLNEQQCDDLMDDINSIIESERSIDSAIMASTNESVASIIAGVGLGSSGVAFITNSIRKWIKSKYTVSINKLISQSKEINDLYTKIDYMLKNDRKARFAHRNDVIDMTIKYLILVDSRNPSNKYEFVFDTLAYDSKYITNRIKESDDYLKKSKDPEKEAKVLEDTFIKEIEDGFNHDHWFTKWCEPTLKVEEYKNQKLERALMSYKRSFEAIYQNIYTLNSVVSYQMEYLHILDISYKRESSIYKNNKYMHKLVESIFKKFIENTTISMDFNSKAIDVTTAEINFYANELEKIYASIRD